ncbi:MAG: hypothetical protein D6770_08025 [Anaerolineae bacterium]|nr:MAG: hypothetical protein D6770_08025 [Anaerolineae bacterium]
MEIVETSIFTRRILAVMDDDEYRALQAALVARPEAGALIPGSGGLRKIRWGVPGRGKRGGVRVIYYWAAKYNKIVMLFVFRKNEASDLTPGQIATLRRIIEEEYP